MAMQRCLIFKEMLQFRKAVYIIGFGCPAGFRLVLTMFHLSASQTASCLLDTHTYTNKQTTPFQNLFMDKWVDRATAVVCREAKVSPLKALGKAAARTAPGSSASVTCRIVVVFINHP